MQIMLLIPIKHAKSFQLSIALENAAEISRLKSWLAKTDMETVLLLEHFEGKELLLDTASNRSCSFVVRRRNL